MKIPGDGTRPELDEEAEWVRSAWIEAICSRHFQRTGKHIKYDSCPKYDGGYDHRTRLTHRHPVWIKIVEAGKQNNIHPGDLISALFKSWVSDQAPTPYLVYRDDNIDRAVKGKAIRRRQLADALRTEEAVFKAAVWAAQSAIPNPREAAAFALNDLGRPMSPVFRYSVAVIKEYPDIADRWRSAARMQVTQDPDVYLEFWSSLMPESLQAEAKAVLAVRALSR